ncbi:hypothetical protein [Roseibium salinum]|uniref:Uncharacterized protein n=1 Tax=Roseibium salinum TaxID=1604349 RepID=A0ABT3QZZ0_9HYPH|nr:hypothetical protein [Roseibium sp. DSM 29163]MCX2722474.1 hypothetical protein [Roseibium sp. DSM 29163]
MSIQINIGDHVSPTAGYITVPAQYRWMFRWSRTKARSIARNIPSANTYFATLPGGRTLTSLLGDNTIWINYNATFNYYGETNAVGGKEMAVGNKAIRIGKWTVLATIIHELAHVNGADGTTDAAERAILACRLGSAAEHRTGVDDPRTPYDPTITG